MTNEEKQLLLKDLCGRLPYGVKCACSNNFNGEFNIISPLSTSHIDMIIGETHPVKPYLGPMSSMTKEERKEYRKVCDLDMEIISKHPMDETPFPALYNSQDWLSKKMFDYRGLIPMGMALEAPEGMYNLT